MENYQAWFAPTGAGDFVDSAQNAAAAYSRSMAGIPPSHNYIISYNLNGIPRNCCAQ